MPWLPYERLVFSSPLPLDQARGRLAALIEPKSWLHNRGKDSFEGRFENDQFKVNRIISYGNGSLPVVLGSLQPAPNGSEVRVRFRLSALSAAWNAVWLTGVLALAVAFPLSGIRAGRLQPWMGSPLGFLALGYASTMLFFNLEAKKAKRILQKSLEADVAPDL
jgi:hypothetical protein